MAVPLLASAVRCEPRTNGFDVRGFGVLRVWAFIRPSSFDLLAEVT